MQHLLGVPLELCSGADAAILSVSKPKLPLDKSCIIMFPPTYLTPVKRREFPWGLAHSKSTRTYEELSEWTSGFRRILLAQDSGCFGHPLQLTYRDLTLADGAAGKCSKATIRI